MGSLERAVELLRGLPEASGDSRFSNLARALVSKANVLVDLAEYREAQLDYVEAVSIFDWLGRKDGRNTIWPMEHAAALRQAGLGLIKEANELTEKNSTEASARRADAAKQFTAEGAILTRLVGINPNNQEWKERLEDSQRRLASTNPASLLADDVVGKPAQ